MRLMIRTHCGGFVGVEGCGATLECGDAEVPCGPKRVAQVSPKKLVNGVDTIWM